MFQLSLSWEIENKNQPKSEGKFLSIKWLLCVTKCAGMWSEFQEDVVWLLISITVKT